MKFRIANILRLCIKQLLKYHTLAPRIEIHENPASRKNLPSRWTGITRKQWYQSVLFTCLANNNLSWRVGKPSKSFIYFVFSDLLLAGHAIPYFLTSLVSYFRFELGAREACIKQRQRLRHREDKNGCVKRFSLQWLKRAGKLRYLANGC